MSSVVMKGQWSIVVAYYALDRSDTAGLHQEQIKDVLQAVGEAGFRPLFYCSDVFSQIRATCIEEAHIFKLRPATMDEYIQFFMQCGDPFTKLAYALVGLKAAATTIFATFDTVHVIKFFEIGVYGGPPVLQQQLFILDQHFSKIRTSEFEVVIKIYFHDPTERPVTCYNILKLFQSPIVDGLSATTMDPKKGLVSESYEEIVFQEPTQLMQHFLMNVQPLTTGTYTHDTDFETKKQKTLENIIDVKQKVKGEINTLKDKLKLARETITKFKMELAKVQKTSNG
ncbi:uncharacterized protein LOC142233258 [Haematobia irritans]|uniref:uncharacterized protein LOC142233258 n=1 Tax=Haematobia irritans TaxID=7368 RepID=UPI003F4F89D0